MTYKHIETGKIATSAMLELQGLTTLEAVKAAGWLQLKMHYADIDTAFEYQEAASGTEGEAVLSEDGTHFVQGFVQGFVVRERDVSQARKNALERVNATYTALVASAKEGVPEDEVLTWDIQKLEAEAWEKDNTTPTPGVDRLAEGRGMDREVLLGKILEKVRAYRESVFLATGVRQKLEDAILAAQSTAEVRAISWPV